VRCSPLAGMVLQKLTEPRFGSMKDVSKLDIPCVIRQRSHGKKTTNNQERIT
jgi:hypothetical protein